MFNNKLLSIFNFQKDTSADNIEDGEVDKVQYDASKFIEYPGFNSPVPHHFIDVRKMLFLIFKKRKEYFSPIYFQIKSVEIVKFPNFQEAGYYRVPSMQFENSKEGLIQSLQNNLTKTYKRKRLKFDVDGMPSTENVKDDDMDIGGSDEEKTQLPMLLPQPRPEDDEIDSASMVVTADDEQEASLLELERIQQELQQALENAESSDSDPSLVTDRNGDSNGNEISEPKSIEIETLQTDAHDVMPSDQTTNNVSITETITELTDTEESIPPSEYVVNISTPTSSGRSREEVFGTPLIKQVSPYTKLPIGDKWSIGVTDVIDFENLPDSTGTYQKLTGVIQKVRTVIKRINDDTEDDSS